MTYGELVNNLRQKHRAYVATSNAKAGQIFLDAAYAIEDLDDICQHQADEIRELKKKLQKSEANIGKWIVDRAFGNDVMSNEQMVICSVCHKGTFYGEQNFCPNCGTKMELEDDN